MLKKSENNGTEEIGLVTPTPGLWVGIWFAGDLVSQTSQLWILHSAEEDNLSPFDSKITCLCQSIKISNNIHMYKDLLLL